MIKLSGKCNTQEISDDISVWQVQASTDKETFSTSMSASPFHTCTIQFDETTPHGELLNTQLDAAGWIQDLE